MGLKASNIALRAFHFLTESVLDSQSVLFVIQDAGRKEAGIA
jgi:hypothetical protein